MPTDPSADRRRPLPPELVELAAAHGVATDFWDWRASTSSSPRESVEAVLAALGVAAHTDESVRAVARRRAGPRRGGGPCRRASSSGPGGRPRSRCTSRTASRCGVASSWRTAAGSTWRRPTGGWSRARSTARRSARRPFAVPARPAAGLAHAVARPVGVRRPRRRAVPLVVTPDRLPAAADR